METMKTLTIGNSTYDITDDGAVRFDGAQVLTPEQQEQARENIGATSKQYVDDACENYHVRSVGHRGCSDAPENTIPAYILAKEKGFDYVECDVSFTKDGVAVLLHDDSIDRTSDGSGLVSDMTYRKLLEYDFGSWKSVDYAGTKIATFDEFLKTCRGLSLHPYIELKTGTTEQTVALVDAVRQAGMRGKVTYIAFGANYLEIVKNADPSARLGYIVEAVNDSVIETATSLQTDSNEVFLNASQYCLTDENVEICIESGLALEAWTVNTVDGVLALHPYVSGVSSDTLIVGKVLKESHKVYAPPAYPSTIAQQWEQTGSADITDELVQGGIQSAAYPYHNDTTWRISYVGLDLSVSVSDVISVEFAGNTTDIQWGIRPLMPWDYEKAVNQEENCTPGDIGSWLTDDCTIPASFDGCVAIWLTFSRRDNPSTNLLLEDIGRVTISKNKG